MDEIKSKLSIALLTRISPLIKANSDKVSIETNKDILFVLKDKNPNYNFFFRAEKEAPAPNSGSFVTFTSKPFSEFDNGVKNTSIYFTEFVTKLSEWFKNIELYKTESLSDDAAEKQYTDEFYQDFKIVDEDAEVNRFNFSQQLLLLSYIENLEKHIEETDELTKEEKITFKKETTILKQQAATETKDSYIKKQSGFWAKLRKKSISVCQFAIKEFGKEVIKELTKKGIAISWESLPHYVENIKNLLN